MTLAQVIVTSIGLLLIWFIYWFFFGKKDEGSQTQNGDIKITVSGGYKPGVIKVNKGQKTVLVLTRTDSNPCLEEIVIPDFKIKQYLPINESISIEITPLHKGEYDIHCGMNMFHGKIIAQ